MKEAFSILTLLALGLFLVTFEVNGHGRVMWPPQRTSIWRHEKLFSVYSPPVNYNDNEHNCGGFFVQHNQNGGKCGECGDAYNLPRPRPLEGGGEFSRGIIVANYTVGQEMDVHVQLTANHLGYFEFRLCPHNNPKVPVEQSCLDQHLLEIVSSKSGAPLTTTRVRVVDKVNNYELKLRLPQGITCSQCVFQWHYLAGNSWGDCGNGTGAVGCGNMQETFRGCSDIAIY